MKTAEMAKNYIEEKIANKKYFSMMSLIGHLNVFNKVKWKYAVRVALKLIDYYENKGLIIVEKYEGLSNYIYPAK